MNNLDPEVAENPKELVVYGGIGRAARDWACFDAIVDALRALGDDEARWLADAQALAAGGFAVVEAEAVRIPEDARHLQDEFTVRLMP